MDRIYFAIVNRGKANNLIKYTKEMGLHEATVILGEGTVRSKVLEQLGLNQTQKELVLIPVNKEQDEKLHSEVAKKFEFSKKNNGISFSIPFKRWTKESKKISLVEESIDYSLLMVIVDQGKHNDIITVARRAEARGGTVIHGRGQGIPQETYFPISLEPQKDTVLIVVHKSIKDKVSHAIKEHIDVANSGKMIALPVVKTTGIFEDSGGAK